MNKMAAIWQTTFSNAFSWKKMVEFWFKCHWNLFPRVQLTIRQHWFRLWLCVEQRTSHYLNQSWLDLLTHICGTKGRLFNDELISYAVCADWGYHKMTGNKFPLCFQYKLMRNIYGNHIKAQITIASIADHVYIDPMNGHCVPEWCR